MKSVGICLWACACLAHFARLADSDIPSYVYVKLVNITLLILLFQTSDQQRNLNERWESTADLRGKENESISDISRNNYTSTSTMGGNPFLSAEN